MNIDLILQFTTIVFIFLSLLLSVFLLTVKSDNKIGNIMLAAYLIIGAINTSAYFYHFYIKVDPIFEMIRMDIGSFLQKPFLYFFILSILYSDFKLERKHLLHIIPFILSTVILLPNFYLQRQQQVSFLSNYSFSLEGLLSASLAHIQYIFYIVLIFITLNHYKKRFFKNHSLTDKFNYSWLFKMNIFLTILLIIAIIKNISKYGFYENHLGLLRLITTFSMLIFICWLFLKALYAPKIFRGIKSKTQIKKTNKTLNLNSDIQDKIDQIKEYMEREEPFVNPELTIQGLSTELKLDVKLLSRILNDQLNKNFYEFINDYRLKKSEFMLKSNDFKNLTILEILYSVGFNSKSSFYTAFKKKHGITPVQYRKRE